MNALDKNSEVDPKRKPVVLIVEDDAVVRLVISEYLRSVSFKVIEAVDATEAKTIFASLAEVDVVFCDTILPGEMGGAKFAEWLYQYYPDIPVLLTSGMPDVISTARASALKRFVAKPYIFSEVESLLRQLLKERDSDTSP